MDISSVLQGGYQHPVSRSWQSRCELTKSMFMYPILISDDPDSNVDVPSLPGQRRWGVNTLEDFLSPIIQKGLKSVFILGTPTKVEKDSQASAADDPNSPVILAIQKLRELFPSLYIAVDVCLCHYNIHGHCGFLHPDGVINTEISVARIADIALAYARAGADCVAPSDMTDGRIKAVKQKLIDAGFGNRCTLMSFSPKFATSLYGPFRSAAGNAPAFGDRQCYQPPVSAKGLARRIIQRDAAEGADIIMIKPALFYLDIIAEATRLVPDHPIACAQVSGEYAMLRAGAAMGIFDLKTVVIESAQCMARAGANIISTYFAAELMEWLDM
ncbi:hypothetical protein AZE42_10419 [Rhizopogon vesiculosus]|uniref:Delta-aminolevulinic acid dehydratase n=1 Tax=Rhizopogon vesiculosus TaxID=180088 RepID=A0A1J8Q620_9AGAM|nr:hypothetical protein AZE42_10419 [Rhizopogon vesiculosus]